MKSCVPGSGEAEKKNNRHVSCKLSTVKADLARSLAVFILACTLISYPSIFSFMFDGRLHPNDTWLEYSLEANLFQLFSSVVLLLILFYPLSRQAARLIDQLIIPSVWYLTIPVSAFFWIINFLLIPHEYQSLHQNRLFPMAISILTALLLLYLMLCALFYRIAVGIIENMRLEQKAQLPELQENRYTAINRHIAETQRLRHDFRHQFRTFQKLIEQKDFQTLSSLLAQYGQSISDSGFQFFCKNPALNALLNYYSQDARSRGITLQWKSPAFITQTRNSVQASCCSYEYKEAAADGFGYPNLSYRQITDRQKSKIFCMSPVHFINRIRRFCRHFHPRRDKTAFDGIPHGSDIRPCRAIKRDLVPF